MELCGHGFLVWYTFWETPSDSSIGGGGSLSFVIFKTLGCRYVASPVRSGGEGGRCVVLSVLYVFVYSNVFDD